MAREKGRSEGQAGLSVALFLVIGRKSAFVGGLVTYILGVDLGTTYSAAAIARDGRVETFTLGASAPAIPCGRFETGRRSPDR